MKNSIEELAKEFKPNQAFYDVPAIMPARIVTKDTLGTLDLNECNVPVPKIGTDEALIAVKAAGINFNTIWTAYGKPVNTFDFLKRLNLTSNPAAIHNLDYHIPGSDASGVIVKLGTDDTKWKVGDSIVANCNWHRNEDVDIYNDSMISSEQKIWGYETNFGSLAAFSVVKLHQLMPKPNHLSWVESASYSLVLCTAYRMLLSDNGLRIKPGDNVLIWGGAGGLGISAIQLCQIIGANPIPVVSDEKKGKFLLSNFQVKDYINRKNEDLNFWKDNEHNPLAWRKLQSILNKRFNGPVDVVFEHPGRETMAASIYVLRKGGKIVTCAATSGHEISYDHRYLWMDSKSIIGCHFANPYESRKANDLVLSGRIKPYVSSVFSFDETNEALKQFVKNEGFGKVVVKVLADKSEDEISSHNLFKV
ncbi:MAG: crotonyl-CoA carboxylase/reductase [Gammaproteobacteria bacterium]